MVTTRVVDQLGVHSSPGGHGRFTPRTRDDRQLLLVFFRGSGVIHHRGRAVSAPAGSLCFLRNDSVVAYSGFDDRGLVLVELPVELSARARERLDGGTGRTITADAGEPAFLRSFVDTLDRQPPGYHPGYPGWVRTCVCDMAERVLAECAPSRPTAAERALQAAKTFILTHLADADLAPTRVAREAAVSLRTLNRLFAAEGDSVQSWIRHHRLMRCRDDLLDPGKTDRSIGQIGAMWGFVDAAHFSRTFKEAFGCSPRAFRTTDLPAAPPSLARVRRVA